MPSKSRGHSHRVCRGFSDASVTSEFWIVCVCAELCCYENCRLKFRRHFPGIAVSLRNTFTPWSRVLPEKLICSQLVTKFPAFSGTRRFITAYPRARHLSLSWARSKQSMLPNPLLEDPFKYYRPVYVRVFQVVSFPQVTPPKPCMNLFFFPYVPHTLPISVFFTWSPE
jgi:hypothetical protein